MVSSRFHLSSLIAVFLALGIGMFIGGLLGERFFSGTENRVLQMMMEKYEQRTVQNEQLKHELAYYKRFSEQAASSVIDKKWMIVSNETSEDELERGLSRLGADTIKVSPSVLNSYDDRELDQLISAADIVVTKQQKDAFLIRRKTSEATARGKKMLLQANEQTDPETEEQLQMESPVVIDVSPAKEEFDDPAQLAHLFEFIEHVLEGSVHDAFGIYRYSRME